MTTNEEIIAAAIEDAKAQPGQQVVVSGLTDGSKDGVHTVVPVPEYKTTLTPEQLEAALGDIKGRSYAGRNPQLGKMINCQVCGLRHRENEKKCIQNFTYEVKDKDGRKYRQYIEEEGENGEVKLTPKHRTSMDASVSAVGKPTKESVVGRSPRPNMYVGPRIKPHNSSTTLQFIKLVREVFTAWEEQFNRNLARITDEAFSEKLQDAYNNQAQNMLHSARIVAGRRLHRANGWKTGELTRRQVQSMRSRGNLG